MEQGLQIGNLLAIMQQVMVNSSLPLGQIQIEKFSGYCQDGTETPFSNWLDDFNFKIESFHLSDGEKARVLVDNLTGRAREEIVFCLSKEKRRSYKEVVKALRLCFSQEDCYYLQGLFHTRVQRTDEDLASFSRALMRLYAQAMDAAEDEVTAAALGQLRDEALSSRFVSGAREAGDRRMLRYLYLKHRGSRFEVLRREALIVFCDVYMLGRDVLTTDDDDEEIQAVLHESVVQQDISPDVGIVEECGEVSTLLDEVLTCGIIEGDGGAEIDAKGVQHDVGGNCVAMEEELQVLIPEAREQDVGPELSPGDHVVKGHKQQPNVNLALCGARSRPKGGNRIDNDKSHGDVGNWMLQDVCRVTYMYLLIGWEQCNRVREVVWGPWETQWKPNYNVVISPPG